MMTEASKQTVLVVDDDFLVRMLAVETLRDCGYEVREAEDGDVALDMLRDDEDVDLLITDVKMPRMNGYELAECALSLRPGMKILLMTGYAQESVPAKITQAGVDVLYKPFDINRLSERAKELLAR